MAVMMLGWIRGMCRDRRLNLAICVAAAVVFAGSLCLTSERARIGDPSVRDLADRLIEAQRREISDMQRLIADLRHD
jgi:signal transduction histidine kinase